MVDAFASVKASLIPAELLPTSSPFQMTATLRPASAALVDVYITIWLCYHLQNAKSGHSRYVLRVHIRQSSKLSRRS